MFKYKDPLKGILRTCSKRPKYSKHLLLSLWKFITNIQIPRTNHLNISKGKGFGGCKKWCHFDHFCCIWAPSDILSGREQQERMGGHVHVNREMAWSLGQTCLVCTLQKMQSLVSVGPNYWQAIWCWDMKAVWDIKIEEGIKQETFFFHLTGNCSSCVGERDAVQDQM